MRKRLVLKRESLMELSAEALRSVVAASDHTICTDCINDISFEVCPSAPIENCIATIVHTTSGTR